jgi:K+-transporting ATPase c subunit
LDSKLYFKIVIKFIPTIIQIIITSIFTIIISFTFPTITSFIITILIHFIINGILATSDYESVFDSTSEVSYEFTSPSESASYFKRWVLVTFGVNIIISWTANYILI